MSSALIAIVHWDGQPVAHHVLEQANACVQHRCPDGAWLWVDGAVGLAQADLATLPEDQPGQAVVAGSFHIVADCRIDNRDEILRSLPSGCQPVNISDTAIILASYAAWGAACVDRLIGEFAFVIWDTHSQHCFAARDISGVRRLFYFQDRNRLLIASEHMQILQDPSVPLEVDDDQMIEFFTPAYQWTSGWDQGMLRGFRALPAGYTLCAERGHLDVQRFWIWRERSLGARSSEAVIEGYLHLLDQAVRDRLRSRSPHVGVELSGGLDSTAVAALAARSPQAATLELHALSLVFDRLANPNERRRIDMMLDRYALTPHCVAADDLYAPRFLRSDWAPRSIVGPHEVALDDDSDAMYQVAVDAGLRVVLTGLIGDSLNDGSDRVYYDLIRRGHFGELGRRFALDLRRDVRSGAGALVYYGMLPFAPAPLLRAANAWLTLRAGPHTMLPTFFSAKYRSRIAAADRSLRMRHVRTIDARSPATRVALEELLMPMIGGTAPLAQPLERRHPYYDRRLVEYVLAMPPELMWDHRRTYAQGADRWHHRRALNGIVPDAILWQNDGMDFSAAHAGSFDRHAIRRWLLDAPTIHTVERGYIQPECFLAALDDRDYNLTYPTMLLATEAWLRALAPGGVMQRLVPPRGTPDVVSLRSGYRTHIPTYSCRSDVASAIPNK